ncbi:MAG: RsmE family RNA methyltransferase [Patescibacteria group bacterium]
MRLHRFYINTPLSIGQSSINIDDEKLVHQWRNVFRLKEGDSVIVFDGSGMECTAEIAQLHGKSASLDIQDSRERPAFSKKVHLFAAVIKKDKFEWLVEKATELGVTSITPVVSERSHLNKLNPDRIFAIVKEASEQSGRGFLPEIASATELGSLELKGKVIALHGAAEVSFTRDVIADSEEVSMLVGPEGGWGERDLAFFKEHNIPVYGLGSLTLRAETAALAAVSLVML